MKTLKGTAVVTGASSGIGEKYAQRLGNEGYDLILIARNEQKLETVAQKIREETGQQVLVFPADLEERNDLEKTISFLHSVPNIQMLVNNAGIGATETLTDIDTRKVERMVSLNISALTQLTLALLPTFIERHSGTIVNIASIVAIAPEVLNGIYGASKAYVLAFSQSLRHEVADKGICIQVVLPGATATNFWDVAGTPLEYVPQDIVMSVDDMVDAAIKGLNMGEFMTIPSLPDSADLDAYEAARQKLLPNLSRSEVAQRYLGI